MKVKKISFNEYPIDLIICILWSLLLIPLVLLNINHVIRIIIGLPFLLFIPGYLFLNILFPLFLRKESSINIIERIALSIIISIVIVSGIGIILNFSPWGLQSEIILLIILILIIIQSILGISFWIKNDLNKNINISINLNFLKSNNRLDRVLKLIVIVMFISTLIIFSHAVIFPKNIEKFTEFYILNENNEISDYPNELHVDEEVSLTIGIINHEHQKMMYMIEIWLVDQTKESNESFTTPSWILCKKSVELDHFSTDNTYQWTPQWEYSYPLKVNKTGLYKVIFLLHIGEADNYAKDMYFKDEIDTKIESAYRDLHIFVNII